MIVHTVHRLLSCQSSSLVRKSDKGSAGILHHRHHVWSFSMPASFLLETSESACAFTSCARYDQEVRGTRCAKCARKVHIPKTMALVGEVQCYAGR